MLNLYSFKFKKRYFFVNELKYLFLNNFYIFFIYFFDYDKAKLSNLKLLASYNSIKVLNLNNISLNKIFKNFIYISSGNIIIIYNSNLNNLLEFMNKFIFEDKSIHLVSFLFHNFFISLIDIKKLFTQLKLNKFLSMIHLLWANVSSYHFIFNSLSHYRYV